MKKIVKLTESDLTRLVKRVVKEQNKLSDFRGSNFVRLKKDTFKLLQDELGGLEDRLLYMIDSANENLNNDKDFINFTDSLINVYNQTTKSLNDRIVDYIEGVDRDEDVDFMN
jgi:hypothetical protein